MLAKHCILNKDIALVDQLLDLFLCGQFTLVISTQFISLTQEGFSVCLSVCLLIWLAVNKMWYNFIDQVTY